MIKFIILPIVSSVLLAAHFSRADMNFLVPVALLFPFILFIKRTWIIRIYQIYLICGGIIWIERLLYLRRIRISIGESWTVMAIILGVVALLSFLSAGILQNKELLESYNPEKNAE